MGNCFDDYCEPFDNAEEAWFWFCRCLLAKRDGLRSRSDYHSRPRVLEVGDIQRIVARLPIGPRAVKVMVRWGVLGQPPYHNARASRNDEALWSLGIAALEGELRRKGALR